MNLRVSRTVWQNVKLRAVHEGITMRELVERALHQALMAPMLGPAPPGSLPRGRPGLGVAPSSPLAVCAGQTGKTITTSGWSAEKHWTPEELP